MSNILTDEELEQLSGFQNGAKQIQWLKREGIHYFLKRNGKPCVTWHFVNNPLGLSTRKEDENQPIFEAISHG